MAYDVIFLSNGEDNADRNWELTKEKAPRAKRVDRVQGLHQAFLASANAASTDMFWLVDADCLLVDSFTFDYAPDNLDAVYVFRSKNPVNDLVYGHGGVKLLPRRRFIDTYSTNKIDVTTGSAQKYVAVNVLSNITEFNVNPEITWRTAFRECAKLAGNAIEAVPSPATLERLKVWCSVGHDRPYGKECIAGANAGREYGEDNCGNSDALLKINDFGWLRDQYAKYTLG
jgi:hypothetical protein